METRTFENGFGSWVWPAYDRCCWPVVFNELSKLEPILELVQDKRTCVQAGGNCGVFPRELSKHFWRVLTFEPDSLNYSCLLLNCTQPNIWSFESALGDDKGWVDMRMPAHEEANCGALAAVHGTQTPITTIDSLDLSDCGLIYLDIEGHELKAFTGAVNTIKKRKPVLVFEDKGLGDSPIAFLETLGYRQHDKLMNDVVMVPC